MAATMASLPAAAAGNDFFIGQFPVEDARSSVQHPHSLHYSIVHDDPGLLETELAGWIPAPRRSQNGVSFSLKSYPVARTPPPDSRHLSPSFLVDYTEPAVQALKPWIERRYGPRPSPEDLEQFVFEYIREKNYAHGFDVASIVAQSRSGDCSEHAILLTALLRMYEYPARTIIGVFVSLQDPVMAFGHAWAEYYGDAGWTGIDGTRVDKTVGAQYIPLSVIGDESIGYRIALIGALRSLSIDRIVVE
jgi:transglutaminase-like putative cysteine protease